jgi:hypothetical protein
MGKIMLEIQSLNAKLQANGGIMPDSWKPFANLLLAILQLVKTFANAQEKTIIDIIIAAIIAAET